MTMEKTIKNPDIINEALEVLRKGGVILYPTDTIWGIGCDATNPEAVSRIYDIKRRSDSKALVLLASDMDMVCRYVKEIPDAAVQLVEVNDRPMTVIYPGAICGNPPEPGCTPMADRHFLAYNVVASDGSVGIRVPDMEFCRNLIFKLGRPIVSTSANISGQPSPADFDGISSEVREAVDFTIDPAFGKGATGKASSIIKVGLDASIEIIRK